MSIFTGSGAAICTPFRADGSFNPEAYEKIIRFQMDNGTDAIITCGTTGEVSTLNNNEHVEVASLAVSTVKKLSENAKNTKIPVIAGAGGNDTRNILLLSKQLQQAGVDGLMLVTPYYNKTSQRGLVEHFTKIAASVDLPIVVYNVPSRTGLNLLPKTVLELSKVENIVAIKEASGNIVQVAEIAEYCGDAITIYSGNDDYIVPVLSVGGKGVISTMANIVPRQTHDIVMNYLEGDTKASMKLQLEMMGLVRALFTDVNPIPVKEALNIMGFEAGACRMPLTTVEASLRDELIAQMKKLGLSTPNA